jgi:23S rRNA (cytidine1920-2'-O)/16S rRNA (cytidine1409-2'-O)-methyltransferase
VIALVKPQFELERPYSGFRGVVKDPVVHRGILDRLFSFFPTEGYVVKGLTFSKLLGPKGNIEFFAWMRKGGTRGVRTETAEGGIERVVADAHAFFAR